MLAFQAAALYLGGSFVGATQFAESVIGQEFASGERLSGEQRWVRGLGAFGSLALFGAGAVEGVGLRLSETEVSVPRTAGVMADVSSGGVNLQAAIAARQRLGSILIRLEGEGTIPLPRGFGSVLTQEGWTGMYSGRGWRSMLGDITTATGHEAGTARVGGVRVLRLGEPTAIDFADASRVIAHTHPSGQLYFSGGDIFSGFRVYQPNQTSSILVGPAGNAVRRPTVFQLPLPILNQ